MEDVEEILQSIPDVGIAGVAGMSHKGRNDEERRKWCIDVFNEVWWEESNNRVIEPDGWHCYGADYCLSVIQLGLKAYVIPVFCCHSCIRRNMEDLLKYQRRLYLKHRKNYKHIYTWMGEVSWLTLKLRLLHKFLSTLYVRIFPDVTIILRKELYGCDTVLDLGCGHHSIIQSFGIPFSVGVELFEPALQESKRKGIHSQYI